MTDLPLVSMVIFTPLIGIVFIMLIRGESIVTVQNIRAASLLTSLATLLLACILYLNFNPQVPERFQFQEFHTWIPSLNIAYHVGIDGMSLLFIILTAILTPISILASWQSIQYRVRNYMAAFLLMETLLIGMFSALDFVLFYLFFESVLIPMYLIIGIWGGERRVYAAYKFFLYTLLGSVLMLLALITIYMHVGSSDILLAFDKPIDIKMQKWLWWAFLASFAVKIPMWPVHTWLPDAHVEAPTAGSVMLAGVLLKMGGYGLLRFSLPLFPDACIAYADFIFVLSVIAVIYTSLVALVQEDMKKLIAYSSVAHMGFVTLGTFTFSEYGVQGAIFQMISHGFVSAALFLCVGVLYDREHTRLINKYGGIVKRMPNYAVVLMIFVLASVGLPSTSGFIGEFLVLISAFQVEWYWSLLAGTGIILGASYMLYMYRRVVFGEMKNKQLAKIEDLNWREGIIFVPLVILIFLLGLYPSPILNMSDGAVKAIIKPYQDKIKVVPVKKMTAEEANIK
jgi:NADH-quinone oxidoreductase subunit M